MYPLSVQDKLLQGEVLGNITHDIRGGGVMKALICPINMGKVEVSTQYNSVGFWDESQ